MFRHFRLIPQNQIDLFEDFEKNVESSILLDQAPIITTETEEVLGEFNLPVSTQIVNDNSQNLDSLVFDLLDGVQGLTNYGQNVSLLTKFDQDNCWLEKSLFLDGQLQEDEVTLEHLDPSLVTGEVILSFNSPT